MQECGQSQRGSFFLEGPLSQQEVLNKFLFYFLIYLQPLFQVVQEKIHEPLHSSQIQLQSLWESSLELEAWR